MTIEATTQKDEAEIRHLIEKWSNALEAKDLDALLADYVPDAVLYDAIPPYKTIGVENIRQTWENCLPYFPEQFASEHRDVEIQVSGDTAFMFGIHHFVPQDKEHPCGQTWMRVTVGYHRVEGSWKVAHEHVSIPFNPMNNQACYVRDPDDLSTPDYGKPPA